MLPAIAYLTLGAMIIPLQAAPPMLNKLEDDESGVWYLAMNLNPADGHVMDYTTGWKSYTCDHELIMYLSGPATYISWRFSFNYTIVDL